MERGEGGGGLFALGREVEATIANPLLSWTRQLVLLMEQGRITLGIGVSMAIAFFHFCVERDEGEGGEGVVVTMASSKRRLASCLYGQERSM